MALDTNHAGSSLPSLSATLELLKPITWFAPMWAYGCGVVSGGGSVSDHIDTLIVGVLLAGPLVCGTSQAVNDWYDRHVDAINEPQRPIPSGRIPGAWGLYIAIIWTAVSLAAATLLGQTGFVAAIVGLALAWAYSAPPVRLKRNGWWGNTAVACCYEGLPWITGAAIMAGSLPSVQTLVIAALYSFGAHGIMTLNDFKSIEGDARLGIRSLPVILGADRAAKVACAMMAMPQVVVAGLLLAWGAPVYGAIVLISLGVQILLMARFLGDPKGLAPWYNGTGTTLYVLGMLVSAFALRGLS
ncbi:MAG: chlorophyll synthase ChlG [Hyphomicrobiaceae bacterium]